MVENSAVRERETCESIRRPFGPMEGVSNRSVGLQGGPGIGVYLYPSVMLGEMGASCR